MTMQDELMEAAPVLFEEEEEDTSEFDNYSIRYPTTSRDDGTPSDDILKDTKRIFAFIHDERHIAAYELYHDILNRLKANPSKITPKQQAKNNKTSTSATRRRKKLVLNPNEEAFEEARIMLAKNRKVLETLEKRAKVFQRAKKKIQKNDDWVLSQTLFGIATYYRRESDNSLSIKMEGKLEGVPIFEQVAVLKEVDLHCTWAPFCSSSMTIKDLNKLDTVGWFCVGVPNFGLARDGCFRAMGCDSMMEDGSIIIVGQGIKDRDESERYDEPFLNEGVDELEVPEVPTGLGNGRMTIRNFSCVVNVLSPDSLETKLVANIDPNLSIIPQGMIDFIMKKLCGVLLYKLQGAAKKAANDPVRNAHARRIRQEHAFYRGWLLPKVKAFCEVSNWEMPKIAAFELTDAQLEQEFHYAARVQKKYSDEYGQREDSQSHSEFSPRSMTQAIDEQSMVSHLSTTSVTSKNPIVKYLKDMDRKTKLRKRQRIAAERERAIDRLKPKTRNDLELGRLTELKNAKAKREGQPAKQRANIRAISVPVQADNGDAPATRRKAARRRTSIADLDVVDTMERFHSHTRKMRLVTMSGLLVAMTIILWPELFRIPVSPALSAHYEMMVTTFFVNVFTIAYLFICAAIHFVVCDVSLVYAFDALELGMKTGKQVKKFYSDTVRLAVVSGSGGLVAATSAKAVAAVWTRVVVWYSLRGGQAVAGGLTGAYNFVGQYIPTILVTLLATLWAAVAGTVGLLVGVVTSILATISSVVHSSLIESNMVGRGIESSAVYASGVVPYLGNIWVQYLNHLTRIYVENEEVNSWREDAISSTRFLLSNTAAFLVLVLVLFNASSRASSERTKKLTEERLGQSTSSMDVSEMLSNDEMDRSPLDDDDVSIATTVHSNRSHRSMSSENPTAIINSKRKKKKFKNPFKRKKNGADFGAIPETTDAVVY